LRQTALANLICVMESAVAQQMVVTAQAFASRDLWIL
jgi:DNA-binding transcriptional regulator YdaS (Cro superfamily)